jgi:hypothetical protein
MNKKCFSAVLVGKAIEARAFLDSCREDSDRDRYQQLSGRIYVLDEILNLLEALPAADEEIQDPPAEEPNPQYRWN